MVSNDTGTAGKTTTADSPAPARWPGAAGELIPSLAGRLGRVRGGLVTVGTVLALVVAMGLTVLGLGAADNAVASFDASSWLWSAAKSEVARVNGVTGRVDTRVEVPKGRGHSMQVTQTDRFLLLRDLDTGLVSSLDLATLQVTATMSTTAGLGVSVAMHDDAAFVIDAVQGIVRQLDPRSLAPVGEPVRYPPGIAGGYFDGEGRLWIAVPSEGTVSAVTAAKLPSRAASGGAGAGMSPELVRTIAVADPSHDLVLSALDAGVAVLDRTAGRLTLVRGDEQRVVPLSMGGLGMLPARTNGPQVPVTVPDDRSVQVVGHGEAVQRFVVPGAGGGLRPAVAWSGRFYCADESTGIVYVFDVTGALLEKIDVIGGAGPLDLEVRESRLFINAPNSATARVVDEKHQIRIVDKYANDVLGGDPPAEPPPPPPPPKKPVATKPGAPKSVTAAAGNAQARVSWQPAPSNGAPIIKYVVRGATRTFEVGADQRSLDVTGLTNGQTYRFSVHAVNAKGAGRARTSNPVVPTSEVPDPPASVTAEARPDGTVRVSWPAANGQGYDIMKYAVTAVSAGATAPVGESTGTELVVPASDLEYGRQYAFTIVAVNEKGAGSASSPVSNSVVPFTAPDPPTGLSATTVSGEKGAIAVAWTAAADNGRPISKYVVEAAGQKIDVTDTQTTVTGLGDGENVTVKVHAVNEAGAGPQASDTARTVAPPQVTITGGSADHTSVTVAVSVDAGGGVAQCTLAVAGGGSASGDCQTLTVGGLLPSTTYTFTVTATNVAGQGTATGSRATPAVFGRSVCVNNLASSDPAQHTWCDDPNNAMGVYSGTSMSTTKIGRGSNGSRYEAICKATGEGINDYVYNPGKMGTSPSDQTFTWIRIKFGTRQGYMSFAWFNLEGYDINSTGPLPTC